MVIKLKIHFLKFCLILEMHSLRSLNYCSHSTSQIPKKYFYEKILLTSFQHLNIKKQSFESLADDRTHQLKPPLLRHQKDIYDLKIRKFNNKSYNKLKSETLKIYNELVPVSIRKILGRIKIGVSTEYYNMKAFYAVQKSGKTPQKLKTFNYNELMAANSFRRDIPKSVSILIVGVIPMGFWLIWVPILIFPRKLFPRSFWSFSQKQLFYKLNHFDRFEHHKVVIHHMEYHKSKQFLSLSERQIVKEILSKLQLKGVVKYSDLILLRKICQNFPFSLESSNLILIQAFCKVFEVSSIGTLNFLTKKLKSKIQIIMELDRKLQKMDLSKLTQEQVIDANYMRGLNSSTLSHEANVYWLKKWLEFSTQFKEDDIWFLLHAMVINSIEFSELKYQRSALD